MKVENFKPDKRYKFIRDYRYEAPYPLRSIDCKKGDVAVFSGKSLGYGNFYVKDRNDKEDRMWVIILKPKEAFRIFEEL